MRCREAGARFYQVPGFLTGHESEGASPRVVKKLMMDALQMED